jgi:type III pantothenate kinase
MSHSPILVIDGGNTRFKAGIWNGVSVSGTVREPYPDTVERLHDRIALLVGDLRVTTVAVTSVSPQWCDRLIEAVSQLPDIVVYAIRDAHQVPMPIRYDSPDTLGLDRLLAAYAAHCICNSACVIVDAGTAVTVDAVDDDGVFIGGYIFPGDGLMADALDSATGLPSIDPTAYRTNRGIGIDTDTCIGNAINQGLRAAVSSLVKYADNAAGNSGTVFLTGGGADIFRIDDGSEYRYEPDLVLMGLGLTATTITGRS